MDVRNQPVDFDENIREQLCCSITQELFVDPVVIETGQTYEREDIIKWFKTHNTCPNTGKVIQDKTLFIPNSALEFIIKYVLENEAGLLREILCPLTKKLMVKPVIISSGRTYEKDAILNWLERHDHCPLTGQPVNKELLIPNYALKGIIEAYQEKQKALAERKTQERKDKGKEKEQETVDQGGHVYLEDDLVLISSSFIEDTKRNVSEEADLEAIIEEWEEEIPIEDHLTIVHQNEQTPLGLEVLKVQAMLTLISEQLNILKKLYSLATPAEREQISHLLPKAINTLYNSTHEHKQGFYFYSSDDIQNQISYIFNKLLNRSTLSIEVKNNLKLNYKRLTSISEEIKNKDDGLIEHHIRLAHQQIELILKMLREKKCVYQLNHSTMFAGTSQNNNITTQQARNRSANNSSRENKRCSLM